MPREFPFYLIIHEKQSQRNLVLHFLIHGKYSPRPLFCSYMKKSPHEILPTKSSWSIFHIWKNPRFFHIWSSMRNTPHEIVFFIFFIHEKYPQKFFSAPIRQNNHEIFPPKSSWSFFLIRKFSPTKPSRSCFIYENSLRSFHIWEIRPMKSCS